MSFDFSFFITSIMLGIGLAMDAFSVSLANGLNEPDMNRSRLFKISGVFGFFQTLMPVIGWVCVHYAVRAFNVFEKFIPWIALFLLLYIGGKMLLDGIKNKEDEEGSSSLLIQGIATSIDALSVGFTISEYNLLMALSSCLIIGLVTFAICTAGVSIGRKCGKALSSKASILGGIILIVIGIEIFISGIF